MNRKLLHSNLSSSSSSLNPFSTKYDCKLSCFSTHRIIWAFFCYASTASSPEDTLYKRIIRFISNRESSVLPVFNQWVNEGRTYEIVSVRKIIKELRHYKHFKHALEVSEWMEEAKHLNFKSGDTAIRLDLISKVHGIEQAEKYFHSIPDDSRNFIVYGALLNCYASARSLDKAEYIMQKIRKLGYATTLAYSVMLNLYSQKIRM